MHTNPIIICFCSVLYYKHLEEHIKRYRKAKRLANEETDDEFFFKLAKFKGRLSLTGPTDPSEVKLNHDRIYTKRIVNKWHLFLRLHLNKELIQYRKENIIKKEKPEKVNIITKIKACCSKTCRKEEDTYKA